jgi:hypothetical protein
MTKRRGDNLDQELVALVDSAEWVHVEDNGRDEWMPVFPLAPKGPDQDETTC